MSKFSKVAKQAQNQPSDLPTEQPSDMPINQPTDMPEAQHANKQNKEKGKRSRSDYTTLQVYVPKKLKTKLDRLLLDLADTGIESNYSTLTEALINSYLLGHSADNAASRYADLLANQPSDTPA
jgi:hypothetical protein